MLPDPVTVLTWLGGAATVGDLDALCGRAALRRAHSRGDVVRLARGRYALPFAPDPLRAAVRLAGVVSHESAARRWGVHVVPGTDRPQVTVRRGRSHLARGGVELHWADLAAAEIEDGHTTVLRTVVDLARTRPFPQALVAADSALRQRLVLPADLRQAADLVCGSGARRARTVARWADGRSESPLESMLRGELVQAGVTGFEPQLQIDDDAFRARVDLGDRRRRLVVEADSFAHHGHRTGLERDCRRYTELTVRGWTVLRFAWEHVMLEPGWVVDRVRAALTMPRPPGRHGRRPPPKSVA